MSDSVLKQEWECFRDLAYYDMWCVRKVGERRFEFGYHVSSEGEARALCEELTLLSDSQLANQERLTEELARVRDRIEGISRLDKAHPVTHALRLLADFNISVGKACEFIRHYMLDGSVDPITEEAQPYDEILDDVAASEIARRWRASEAELATERANQERLVGEMQEMRQVVKAYRISTKNSHNYSCDPARYYPGLGFMDDRCPTCIKADALLAKDTLPNPRARVNVADAGVSTLLIQRVAVMDILPNPRAHQRSNSEQGLSCLRPSASGSSGPDLRSVHEIDWQTRSMAYCRFCSAAFELR